MASVDRPAKTSKELGNAIYDDWKRKVVDEAKKRAVAQNVDYETFKNMVHVAHLKPINAQSQTKHESMLPSWNFNPDGSKAQQHMNPRVQLAQAFPQEPPSTSGDFYRDWRRNCPGPDDKYRYLQLCGPAALVSLFKVEINIDVLKDVLAILDSCWQSHAGIAEEGYQGGALQEVAFVVQILESLTNTGRFGLTVKLMGSAATKVLDSLFQQLSSALEASQAAATAADESIGEAGSTEAVLSHDRLQQLRLAYGVKSAS